MTCRSRVFVGIFVFVVAASAVAAQTNGALSAHEQLFVNPVVHVASIADLQNSAAKVTSRFNLGALSSAERAELMNIASNDFRAKVGVQRTLASPLMLDLSANEIPTELPATVSGGLLERRGGDYVWTGAISSEGAGGIRAHFTNTALPKSARVFVYASSGEVHGPYTASEMADSFWANSVFDDVMYVEVQFPMTESDRVHVEVKSITHLEHHEFAPPRHQRVIEDISQFPCFMSSACVPSGELSSTVIQDRAKAIALILIQSAADGQTYVCTGGLLAHNGDNTQVPYFLTANHCLSKPSEAASLEVFWDYKYASCGGTAPAPASLPRQTGATLLATSDSNTGVDFTFLKLNQIPPGSRWYLGWDANDIRTSANKTLYRLAHPEGEPLHYSRQATTGVTFSNPGFLMSTMSVGAITHGSSGSPVFTYSASSGAQVVGDLGGTNAANQTDLENLCNYSKYVVRDGAFSQAYSQISPWLNGTGSPITPQPCIESSTQICLVKNRFQVSVAYDAGSGLSKMTAIKYTPETGLFWFTDAGNIEVLLKMIDACDFNAKFWVYAGGTTDVQVNVTVTDTKTGTTKNYTNQRGKAFVTITDSNAFSCP